MDDLEGKIVVIVVEVDMKMIVRGIVIDVDLTLEIDIVGVRVRLTHEMIAAIRRDVEWIAQIIPKTREVIVRVSRFAFIR